MAETHERRLDGGAGEDETLLRQRLLRRIGLAGVLIVALVASLAMFDAVFVTAPAPEAADPAPVAVNSTAAPAEASPAAEAPTEAPADSAASMASIPADKPEDKAATPEKSEASAPTPTPPVASAKGKSEIKPITQPVSRPPAKAAPVVSESTAAPTLPPPPPPPVVKSAPVHPLTQNQGYLVQMGVFSNIANAEELKGRLDKAGIPAHIEARVQVGPFKNKAEAAMAQKKLSEMGLSGLLLSPRK